MDRPSLTNVTVAASGAALVVLIWAGWSAVVRPAPPDPGCTVGSLSPGRYDLELIATAGAKAGATAIGMMTLRCVTEANINYEGCRPLAHLVGFAELDFESVGAPVINRTYLPRIGETSIWAGVAVFTLDGGQLTLVSIQTVTTPRFACMSEDGDGIALLVLEADPASIAGTWGASGLFKGGNGTFTMRYSGPE